MNFDEWVGVAVFPFDFLVGLRCRLGQKREARLIVAKYDRAIGCGVNTAFHNLIIIAKSDAPVKTTRGVMINRNALMIY